MLPVSLQSLNSIPLTAITSKEFSVQYKLDKVCHRDAVLVETGSVMENAS